MPPKTIRKRVRTSTVQNPRNNKRPRTENDNAEDEGPGAPPQGSDDALSLQLHEGMTRDELYQTARELQARVNEAQRACQEEGRNVLADITNESTVTGPTEEEIDEQNDLKYIQARGKQFVVAKMIWMPGDNPDAVFEAKADPMYNPLERFSTRKEDQPKNRIQGALRDVYDLIPEQYRGVEEWSDWVQDTFSAAMGDQRSFTVTRLRDHPQLFDRTALDFSSSEKREQFCKLIGRKLNKKGVPYYDTVDVPILYADYDGDAEELDLDNFLLAESLFWIHAAITRGPAAALAMKCGTAAPKCQAVEQLWALRKTTPGMIAAAAMWLRWVHSADQRFTAVGETTGIRWNEDFEFYLKYLINGLRDQKDCVVNIFRVWDQKFYPNSEESTARTGDEVDAEAEEMRDSLMQALDARPSVGGD